MHRQLVAFLILIAAVVPGICAADPESGNDGLQPGEYKVGFQIIEAVDTSRSIRVHSASKQSWPRPVRVYLWYPAAAEVSADSMTFSRYADLAAEDVWPESILGSARGRMEYSKRPLARSLGADQFGELRARPVLGIEDAPAAQGRFPLIIVAQGLYYESPVSQASFCENLASHGFVVATTPLVGTHSPLVTLDVVDLETQVRDLEFVLAEARRFPFVDPSDLGVFGFDMGGMAALVFVLRNPDVDAFASTDSAILFGHPAGIPELAHHYDPSLLRRPWFHATQRRFGIRPDGHEGPDLFAEAVHADRFLLLTEGMGHWDFTSYALVQGRDPIMGYWPPPLGGEAERYAAVCNYIRSFFLGFLAGDPAGRSLLEKDPEQVAPGLDFAIEYRAGTPPEPTYADFLNALAEGNIESARKMAFIIHENDPDSPVSREAQLNRLGYHLIASWELFDAGIAVFEINRDLHPKSINVYDSLGEAFIWKGDDDAAMQWFEKVLELDPENGRAMRIIDQLKNGKEAKAVE